MNHNDKRRKLFNLGCLFLFALVVSCLLNGCTRRFFRERADKEAHAVLAQKDCVPHAKIEQFYLDPHPLSRFFKPYNPDYPPMPPDDCVVAAMSPAPQKPYRQSCVAWVEGTGYLSLLEKWNNHNRAQKKFEEEYKKAQKEQREAEAKKKATEKKNSGEDASFLQLMARFEGAGTANKKRPIVQLGFADPADPSTGLQQSVYQGEPLPPPRKTGDPKKDKGGEQIPPPRKVKPNQKQPEELPDPKKVDEKKDDDVPSHISPSDRCCAVEREPYLITLEQAVMLGLINSREYQSRREDLYLTALPVTLQRYSFAAQFFFTEEAIRERLGQQSAGGKANRWVYNSGTGFAKLFSTGALLTLQFANQTIINLTGVPRHTISTSDINLDIVQPFLRGGGKAVTLEPLTQVERDLVYEIRSFARFRKEFFVSIAAGDGVTAGNTPGFGGGVGIANLEGVRGPTVTPGSAGRVILATGLTAPPQGYLPTLLIAARLENERKNLRALEGYRERFLAELVGGVIRQIQVDQVELNLLQSRTNILQQEQDLKTALDQLKQQLGIKVCIGLELDDSPIRGILDHVGRFERIFRYYKESKKKIEDTLDDEESEQTVRQVVEEVFRAGDAVLEDSQDRNLLERWEDAKQDGPRKKYREKLAKLARYAKLLVDLKRPVTKPNQREQQLKQLAALGKELKDLPPMLLEAMEYNLQRYGKVLIELKKVEKNKNTDLKTFLQKKKEFQVAATAVQSNLLKLLKETRFGQLDRLRKNWPKLPEVMVCGMDLIDTQLPVAHKTVADRAHTHRLDLLNARAQVVDAWRQIAIFANSLLGVFNVRYHMDSFTPRDQAKPLNFDGRRTRHQLIFNAELPLVRKGERNNYRASLIAFERARRALMAVEDSVAATVRNQVRQLRLLAENYKIQQKSVELAFNQEESANEELFGVPQPGSLQPTGAGSAALTNQLLGAQQSLINAQNAVYQVYINYLITRLQLYRDLELMPLDHRGVWLDELANTQSIVSDHGDQQTNQRRRGSTTQTPTDPSNKNGQ